MESHDEYVGIREDLEKIAPTVFFDFDGAGSGLRNMTLELSRVVGDGERAEAEQQRFEERVEEISTAYADQLADTTFALVFGVDGEFAVVNTNAWGGEILHTLGAKQSKAQQPAGENFAAFYSYEEIDELSDADVIFYETDAQENPDPFTEALLEQKLWQSLPAGGSRPGPPPALQRGPHLRPSQHRPRPDRRGPQGPMTPSGARRTSAGTASPRKEHHR